MAVLFCVYNNPLLKYTINMLTFLTKLAFIMLYSNNPTTSTHSSSSVSLALLHVSYCLIVGVNILAVPAYIIAVLPYILAVLPYILVTILYFLFNVHYNTCISAIRTHFSYSGAAAARGLFRAQRALGDGRERGGGEGGKEKKEKKGKGRKRKEKKREGEERRKILKLYTGLFPPLESLICHHVLVRY